MEALLGEAAAMKKAQLASRPGRQEWELSPDFLKMTAFTERGVLEDRALPLEDRVKLCAKYKEEGNKAMETDPEAALEHYSRALGLLIWFDRGKNKSAEDLPLKNSLLDVPETDPVREQGSSLVSVCLSNAAAILIKDGSFVHVIFVCR
eukprot:gene25191-10830_t